MIVCLLLFFDRRWFSKNDENETNVQNEQITIIQINEWQLLTLFIISPNQKKKRRKISTKRILNDYGNCNIFFLTFRSVSAFCIRQINLFAMH